MVLCGVGADTLGTGQTPAERVEYLIKLMDTDGDGKISLAEFKAGVKKDPEIAEGVKSCVFRVI